MSEAPPSAGARRPLSVCVMARDEAENIEACLRSTAFADEWVVVDSHSTDETREIARAFGAHVIERDWPGHIAQANYAIAQATHDWVLFIDADERVSPELRVSIEEALARPDLPDGFRFPRLNHYLGRWIRHGGWYPDHKLKLFRRTRGRFAGVDPHNHVEVDGRVETLEGDLLHYSFRSLSAQLRTLDSFTTIAAREKAKAGRAASLFDVTVRPFSKFVRMYLLERGFLDGVPGFVAAVVGAFYVFMKYAKLWELGRPAARD